MSVKPPYTLCPICNRITRGFGYHDRHKRLWTRWGQSTLRYFCSRQHQEFYHAIKKKHGEEAVIDPTPHERKAMHAAIKPLSEFIDTDTGWDTPLSAYDQYDILNLIEVIVTAYHESLIASAENQWPEITIPFDPNRSMKRGA